MTPGCYGFNSQEFDEDFYSLCSKGEKGEEAFKTLRERLEGVPMTEKYQHYLRARNYRIKKNKKRIFKK